MTRSILVVSAFIGLVVLVANPSIAAVQQVMVSDFVFTPRNVTVAAGDSVKWVWVNGMHTATSGDTLACSANAIFDGPLDVTHPTFIFRFTTSGQFPYFCRFHCALNHMRGLVTVQNPADVPSVPSAGRDLWAMPNPFHPSTVLFFHVGRAGPVRLEIFDASGRLVSTLANRTYNVGDYSIPWDGRMQSGSDLPSGVYFARRTVSGATATAALMLLR